MSENEEEIKEEVVSEEERKDEDLIKNNCLSILGLNIDFENALLLMKQFAGGSSPEALLLMVEKLANEYELEAKKLSDKKNFKLELDKERSKIDGKLEKTKLDYEIRRKKYLIRRRKKLNKKLFKLFKNRILLSEIRTLNKSKSDLNEKKEETNVSSHFLSIETKQTNERIKALNAPSEENKTDGS